MAQLSDYHSSFGEYERSVDSVRFELEDCLSLLSDEIESLDEGSIDIDSIEERLDLIYRLSRKYGSSEEEMLEYLEKIKAEYENIETSGERASELEEELSVLENQVLTLAGDISEKRRAYAETLEKQVMAELAYLDMKGSVFKVSFKETQPGKRN